MTDHEKQASGEMDKSRVRSDVKKVLGFRMELNYRLSAWDRLDAEPDPFVLANLLLTWMEHLKSPILDQACVWSRNLAVTFLISLITYRV